LLFLHVRQLRVIEIIGKGRYGLRRKLYAALDKDGDDSGSVFHVSGEALIEQCLQGHYRCGVRQANGVAKTTRDWEVGGSSVGLHVL
jgi:hypothetical protein